jgi:DNA-binding NtrC family response regulator
LAQEIKKIRDDIPLVLASGFGDNFTRKAAISIGISEFIMKPLDLKKLAEMVRKSLDEK